METERLSVPLESMEGDNSQTRNQGKARFEEESNQDASVFN